MNSVSSQIHKMDLSNEFLEKEKSVQIVPGQNGMAFRRSFYSNEQRQKDLRFLREITEENHESSVNIENYKAYVRDAANGDVSFSSYLMVGSQEVLSSTSKESLVDHNQSKVQEKDVASFPIASCSKSDASVELGKDYEYSAQSKPKPIETSFNGPVKSAISNVKLESKSPYRYGHGDNQMGDSNGSSNFVRGLLMKQKTTGKKAPVIGRYMTDSEISIFGAERYFSVQEEKKAEADESKSTENVQKLIDNPKGKMEAKNRGFLDHDILNNSHAARPTTPAFSAIDVSRGFRSLSFRGGTTPTSSSEASWNSHSGLLSNFTRVSVAPSLHKLPSSEANRATGKWNIPGFGCKCPCSGKKSVETDDTLTEARRAASAPNSLPSSRLNSPLSSTKYRYPVKMSLGKSSEKHKTSVTFLDEESDRDVNAASEGVKLKAILNPPISADNSLFRPDLKKDLEYRTDARKFGEVSTFIPAPHEFGEGRYQRRIIGTSSSKEDVFSFPILQDNNPSSVNSSLKSEEKMKPSLQVLASSPFHALPSASMEEMRKSDLHSRLMLSSLDKARKSFTFDPAGMSVNPPPKFDGEQFRKKHGGLKYNQENVVVNDGENNKNDAESDSSSDLFEIESFTTQGTGYPLYNRRKDSIEISHVDDISSIESSYAPSEVAFNRRDNSFQFASIEEAVTPSALSSCYEPSEASVDWSVTTGDTMDKPFSSYYEDLKMIKKHSISGFKENTYRAGNFNSKRSTGMLGCGCSEKAVNVAETNPYPISHNQQRRAACKKSHSVPISRFKNEGESKVADINSSAAFEDRCTSDLMTGKRSISQTRTGHH